MAVATCMTSNSYDLARVLVAAGWARITDDGRQQYEAEAKAAEEQGLGVAGWKDGSRAADEGSWGGSL
jgi:endonuclease YncB( thermonuclease family)